MVTVAVFLCVAVKLSQLQKCAAVELSRAAVLFWGHTNMGVKMSLLCHKEDPAASLCLPLFPGLLCVCVFKLHLLLKCKG